MRSKGALILAIVLSLLLSSQAVFVDSEGMLLSNDMSLWDDAGSSFSVDVKPLFFNGIIENRGQFVDNKVLYYAATPSGGIALKKDSVLINVERTSGPDGKESYPVSIDALIADRNPWHIIKTGPREGCTISMSFEGANDCLVRGLEPLPGYSNFLLGNDSNRWAKKVSTFKTVVFEGLYDGIDLVYRMTHEGAKYEFILAPEANPQDIVIKVEGQESLSIRDHTELVIHTNIGNIRDSGLVVFYEDDTGSRIPSRFKLLSEDAYGFELESFDPSRTVIIDPLLYCSYLGGTGTEIEYGAYDVQVDGSGNVYLVGMTESSDFPTTAGAYRNSWSGGLDSFITKMSGNGSVPIFSTFFGGRGDDEGNNLCLDALGRPYLTGPTDSTDLPTTSNALQSDYSGGSYDGFLTVFSANGTELVYSTYFGTTEYDSIYDHLLGPDGSIFIAGGTSSKNHTTTAGAYQAAYGGGAYDGYIAKLNASMRSLDYLTYIGGNGSDLPTELILDDDGSVLVSGVTNSSDFHATPGAFDTTIHLNEKWDGFILRLNRDATAVGFSTFLGRNGDDIPTEMAWGPMGSFYVVGYSNSSSLPTTPGAYRTVMKARRETFVYRFSGDGSTLLNGTLFGASGNYTSIIAVDILITDDLRIIITGYTNNADLPTTERCAQDTLYGSWDSLIAVLNSNLTELLYCSYHGGSSAELIGGSANIGNNTVWVIGHTYSDDIPTTPDAYQATYNGNNDAFFSKFLIEVRIPCAAAGPDVEIEQHKSVRFNGTGSSDGVAVINWTWTFEYLEQRIELYGPTPEFTFHEAGEFIVSLTVCNALDFNDTDTMTVTVLDTTPPVVDPGENITVPQHSEITFDGSRCSDNVGIKSWNWTFTYQDELIVLEGIAPRFTFEEAGVFIVTLIVQDAAGNEGTDTLTIIVLDTTSPIADAGSYILVNQQETVTFNGSRSTDNIGVINWTWTFNHGDIPVTLFGPTPSYAFEHAGRYTVLLTVADAEGNTAIAEVIIEVIDVTPPIAFGGEDKTIDQGQNIAFDGRGSTDDVGISSWEWTFDLWGELITLTGSTPEFHFTLAGMYEVTLTVTDIEGNQGMDIVVITVRDVTAPIAYAGDNIAIDQHEMVTFDGSASEDNVEITNFTWKFAYMGEPIELYGSITSFPFDEAGMYEVTMTVRDAEGNTASDNLNVAVVDITSPKPDAGADRTVNQYVSMQFDGSGSTDNVGIETWTWAFNYAGDLIILTEPSPSFTFDLPGVYDVTLEVMDAAKNSASANVTVMVKDITRPVTPPISDITTKKGEKVTFDGSGSTDNVGIVRWVWTFNEDSKTRELEGEIVKFKFNSAGEYDITLTVYDADGNMAIQTFTVTVEGTGWLLWVALGAVVVIVAMVAIGLLRRRRAAPAVYERTEEAETEQAEPETSEPEETEPEESIAEE
jgi:PKD repeat protein